MTEMYDIYYESPIGRLKISGSEAGITNLDFETGANKEVKAINNQADNLYKLQNAPECLREAMIQLDEYFNGMRKEFSLKLQIEGTEFQKKVWQELLNIPYGATKSYKDIACAISNPKAVRAVGGANNKNKIAIIIPCHRVIGINGSLTGYAGELWRKEWLLNHESKYLNKK